MSILSIFKVFNQTKGQDFSVLNLHISFCFSLENEILVIILIS